jgi:signal transduction histidine kinase
MPSGGRLTLSTTNVTLPELQNGLQTGRTIEYIALKIADTGAGMTPEIRARIFEPYRGGYRAGQGPNVLHLSTAQQVSGVSRPS